MRPDRARPASRSRPSCARPGPACGSGHRFRRGCAAAGRANTGSAPSPCGRRRPAGGPRSGRTACQDVVRNRAGGDREAGPGQHRRGHQQCLPGDFGAVRLFRHGRGFADRFDAIHQHVVDREVALEQDVQRGVDAVLVVGLEQLLQLRSRLRSQVRSSTRLPACTMAWLMLTRRWLSADSLGESLEERRIVGVWLWIGGAGGHDKPLSPVL
jgi:hypothetical protein